MTSHRTRFAYYPFLIFIIIFVLLPPDKQKISNYLGSSLEQYTSVVKFACANKLIAAKKLQALIRCQFVDNGIAHIWMKAIVTCKILSMVEVFYQSLVWRYNWWVKNGFFASKESILSKNLVRANRLYFVLFGFYLIMFYLRGKKTTWKHMKWKQTSKICNWNWILIRATAMSVYKTWQTDCVGLVHEQFCNIRDRIWCLALDRDIAPIAQLSF